MNEILHAIARSLVVLFPVSEVLIAARKRAQAGTATVLHDQGSIRLLWIVIMLSLGRAAFASRWRPGQLGWPPNVRSLSVIAFMVGGLALRWTSIATLGRFFTVNVAVHD